MVQVHPRLPTFMKTIDEQIENLKKMKDEDIDTSDIPEVFDWSRGVRGKFYHGGKMMADTLTKLFDDYKTKTTDPSEFQLFQAGFTAAAVSMRQRAMEVVDKNSKDVNAIKNGIGQLSDIP